MLAAIVAANMSACSNFMVNTGALFTKNFYKKYINPDAGDRTLSGWDDIPDLAYRYWEYFLH